MIGRVVITSVPQGIGGGSGFQPVLRTQALKPSIAERLAMRASYPHPFSFGDPNNPRVLFHRIETVGDRTIHILGSVRDAGSSYTGRSNHLAELIAIDSAETRRLPGGPVFAAQSFPWLARWAGEPREVPLAEEPVVPANDPACSGTSTPTKCVAWAAAAGDPGWAGELAQSFLDGRRAIVWVGKNDDAAALFAEAARLLPVSVRWQVEFNTCEIEPFPAHWRALREDLTVVGPRPASGDLVIDLSTIKRDRKPAPDHALAIVARGEAASLATQSDPHIAGSTTTLGGTLTGVEDESALRARLQEISEARRRRSRQDSAVRSDPWDRETARLWWRAAVAVIVLLPCSVVSVLIVIGLPGHHKPTDPGNNESTDNLKSREQEKDIRETAKRDKIKNDENEKVRLEEERDAEANRKRLAEEAELHRQREIADRERLDREKSDAEAKKKADAIQAAFKAFESEPSSQTAPLALTRTEKPLCRFDAEHLIDPSCDLAVIDTDTISIEREPATDQTPFAWTVTGKQFDRISGIRRDPIVVCRLVVREGSLRIEWPNTEISDEHELFRALENGMLLVSCKNVTGDSEIVRKILLAEPIDLASANKATIALDPLAEKSAVSFDSQVAQRMKDIPPEKLELEWTIELTHPKWPSPRQFNKPDTEDALKFPSAELEGIEIGYQDANPKSGSLDKFVGKLRVEATLRFSPEKASISLIGQKVTGLDNVPQLKSAIHINTLNEAYGDDFTPLVGIVHNNLRDRLQFFDNNVTPYESLVLDAFLKTSEDAKALGIKNAVGFFRSCIDLATEASQIQEPGKTKGKLHHPMTNENVAKYNELMTKLNKRKNALDDITDAFIKDHISKTLGEATHVKTVLDTNRDWFGPITVKIVDLWAIAKDSKGREYPIQIVKPLQ